MGDRDDLCSIGHSLACRDLVHSVENVGAVVSVSALLTDTDGHVFQNNEPALVLKGFTLDRARLDSSFAILTWIAVHNFLTSIYRNRVNGDDQIAVGIGKPADHADLRLSIRCKTLDYVPIPSRVISFDARYAAIDNGILYIGYVQIILGHFLHCMRGHIIRCKSDLLPDSFKP